jgi:hypothetical protein
MADKQITYLDRDFKSLKGDIKQYLKDKYPDMSANIEDENSIVSLLLDLNATVADTLNFYIDKQFNEMFITTAQETDSIYRLAHMFGYSPKKKQPASGFVTFYIDINSGLWNQGQKTLNINLPRLDMYNSYFSLTDDDGVESKYRILHPVDFNNKTSSFFGNETSKIENNVTWSWSYDGIYKVMAKVAVEGSHYSNTTLGPFTGQAFEKWNIYDEDYYKGFLTHVDWDDGTVHYTGNSFGDLWFEVDYMANPYGLVRTDHLTGAKSRTQTRRRYITRNTSFGSSTIFGYQSVDALGMADRADYLSHPEHGGASLGDPLWPLGKRPDVGTNLIHIYLQSKGSKTNQVADSLKTSNFTASYELVPTDLGAHAPKVLSSGAMIGGSDGETIEEIRHQVHSIFLNQNRAVTAEDYVKILERIPTSWGVPLFRAGADVRDVTIFKDPSSMTVSGGSFTHKEIDLYAVKRGADGRLAHITDSIEQQSLANYVDHYRMMTDAVFFRKPEIIDINIEYSLNIHGNVQAVTTVNQANEALRQFFRPENWIFGQPILYDDVTKLLSSIYGVKSVVNFLVYEDGDASKSSLFSNQADLTGSTLTYPHQIYQFNNVSGDVV